MGNQLVIFSVGVTPYTAREWFQHGKLKANSTGLLIRIILPGMVLVLKN